MDAGFTWSLATTLPGVWCLSTRCSVFRTDESFSEWGGGISVRLSNRRGAGSI
jgi:hypothetical protein